MTLSKFSAVDFTFTFTFTFTSINLVKLIRHHTNMYITTYKIVTLSKCNKIKKSYGRGCSLMLKRSSREHWGGRQSYLWTPSPSTHRFGDHARMKSLVNSTTINWDCLILSRRYFFTKLFFFSFFCQKLKERGCVLNYIYFMLMEPFCISKSSF